MPNSRIRLSDVISAYEYATQCMTGIDFGHESYLEDSQGYLADYVHCILENIVHDESEGRPKRFQAAVAQFVFSRHNDEEIREAIREDPLSRSLLKEGMHKEDRTKWKNQYDIVGKDVMTELSHLLDD